MSHDRGIVREGLEKWKTMVSISVSGDTNGTDDRWEGLMRDMEIFLLSYVILWVAVGVGSMQQKAMA